MVPHETDAFMGLAPADEPFEDRGRVRAAVNIVAEENMNGPADRVGGKVGVDPRQQLIKQVEPAMDIANGVDTYAAGNVRPRRPRIDERHFEHRSKAPHLAIIREPGTVPHGTIKGDHSLVRAANPSVGPDQMEPPVDQDLRRMKDFAHLLADKIERLFRTFFGKRISCHPIEDSIRRGPAADCKGTWPSADGPVNRCEIRLGRDRHGRGFLKALSERTAGVQALG